MRVAVVLSLFSVIVLAGCCNSRAACVAPACDPCGGTIVRVSDVYSDPGSRGVVVRESPVYSVASPATASRTAPRPQRVAKAFVPPPPPALPAAGAKPVACTPVVPTARPACPTPTRRFCIPIPRRRACPPPAAQACVGGNCGVPSLDDCCPGGNCGIPSLDACAPPIGFDPCAK